ncbi:hypothetical protein SRHO_G00236790 [Serrasalmus rhombeus]
MIDVRGGRVGGVRTALLSNHVSRVAERAGPDRNRRPNTSRGRRGGRGLVVVWRVSVCVRTNAQELRSRSSLAFFRPLVSIFSFALRNSALRSKKLEQNRGLNSQKRRIAA